MELWGTEVPSHIAAETGEKHFQVWIGDHVRTFLDTTFPDRFTVKIEPAGGKVTPIRTFGTSFWPDISVESSDDDRLVAVEVKCLRGARFSGQLSQALGQALMYKQLYAQSVVALIPLVRVETPAPPFFENVSEHGIEVTMLGPVAGLGASE
jgi:hypothetical protein